MKSQAKLRCIVVTPERTVLEEEADFAAIPAFDGELGILVGHAPLVARLGPGELRLVAGGQVRQRLFVDGGFAQVRSDTVTVLTPRADAAAQLDRDALLLQLAEIQAQVPATDPALDAKAARLRRARAQLRLARR